MRIKIIVESIKTFLSENIKAIRVLGLLIAFSAAGFILIPKPPPGEERPKPSPSVPGPSPGGSGIKDGAGDGAEEEVVVKEKDKDKDEDDKKEGEDGGGDGGGGSDESVVLAEVIMREPDIYVRSPEIVNEDTQLKGKRNTVSTNEKGQAEIVFKNGRKVFVFLSSGIQMSRCSRERKIRSRGDCMRNGLTLVNSNNIKKDIETKSVIVRGLGTLYAIFSFPKSENPKFQDETIIVIFDEIVELTPFQKENPQKKTDFGSAILAPKNYFIIVKPGNKTQIAGYNTLELYEIPDKYQDIRKIYDYFGMWKWLGPLNDKVEAIALQENLTVRILPAQPQTKVTEVPPPNPGGSPKTITDTIDFGQAFAGQRVIRTYILKNEDDIPVDIPIEFGDIEIAGGAGADFEILDDDCTRDERLRKNEQCAITLAFTAKNLGKRSDTLIINQDADNTKLEIKLLGESIKEPPVNVTTSNNGRENFEFQRIKYGNIEKTIDINISGPRKILFSESDFAVTGEGKDDFKITDTSNCRVAGGVEKKCSVKVLFNPSILGERKAFLEVRGKKMELNGSPGDQTSLLLTKSELFGAGAVPKFTINKETLCFKREKKNTEGSADIRARDTIIVTNTGNIPLTIENKEIVQKEKDFRVDGNTCSKVSPGQTCQITIAFSPTGRKLRTGKYRIRDKNYDGNLEETSIDAQMKGVGKPYNPISRFFYKTRGYWIKPCEQK